MVQEVRRQVSADRSIKFLWGLPDGNAIESVYLPFRAMTSVCVSSQVGCALRCQFCATGIGGLVRNLDVSEIVEHTTRSIQAGWAANGRFLFQPQPGVDEVAFKGMGEPLHNLDQVLDAMDALSVARDVRVGGFGLSTAGLPKQLQRLQRERPDVALQVSLHAPTNDLRNRLVPINRKFPVESVIASVAEYAAASPRVVILNYLLLNGVNDSEDCAYRLIKLLAGIPVILQIATYNPVEAFDLRPATAAVYDRFCAICETELNVWRFDSLGADVEGGCGQLRAQKTDQAAGSSTP